MSSPYIAVSFPYSQSNDAERLFAEMSVKNGATYDALILGLVKVSPTAIAKCSSMSISMARCLLQFMNFDRAWEMFDEMRKDGHQGLTSSILTS